jgi:K+:H+ antiporter
MRQRQRHAALTAAGRASMTERPEPRILRIAAVYAGLVIVPSLAALAFLDAHRGKGRHLTAAATSTSAHSGTAFMQLLLAVAIIVAACAAMGWLMRRLGQPAVIGEILTGIILGPSLFGA